MLFGCQLMEIYNESAETFLETTALSLNGMLGFVCAISLICVCGRVRARVRVRPCVFVVVLLLFFAHWISELYVAFCVVFSSP